MKQIFYLTIVLLTGANIMLRADPPPILQARILTATDKLMVGGENPLAIELKIQKDWHINGVDPGDNFLIPTAIILITGPGIEIGDIQYPLPEEMNFAFIEKPIYVYQGTVFAYTSINIPDSHANRKLTIKAIITYQACNDETCLPPGKLEIEEAFSIAALEEQLKAVNMQIFNRKPGHSIREEKSIETHED